MAGRAQSRFVARTYARMIDRSNAYQRGQNEYGVDCIYCEKYFANVNNSSIFLVKCCPVQNICFLFLAFQANVSHPPQPHFSDTI